MTRDGIIVIERFERGGLVAYSIDGGETFHETTRQAFEHEAERLRTEVKVRANTKPKRKLAKIESKEEQDD